MQQTFEALKVRCLRSIMMPALENPVLCGSRNQICSKKQTMKRNTSKRSPGSHTLQAVDRGGASQVGHPQVGTAAAAAPERDPAAASAGRAGSRPSGGVRLSGRRKPVSESELHER